MIGSQRSLFLPTVIALLYGASAFINPTYHHCPRQLHTFGIKQSRRDSALMSTRTPGNDTGGYDDSFDKYDEDEEDFDCMEELRLRLAKNRVLGPGMEDSPKPRDVFVILFCANTDDEGIHTIEFPKGSGNNMILAFESVTECEDFAGTLRDQHFFDPEPTEIMLRDLEEYSEPLGVELQLVPRGTELVPPSDTVDNLNHNPYLKKEKEELDRLFCQPSHEPTETVTGSIYLDDKCGDWE